MANESVPANVLRGRITGIRTRGQSVEVTVRAGEEFSSRVTPASLEKMGLRLGLELYLLIKAESIRLL